MSNPEPNRRGGRIPAFLPSLCLMLLLAAAGCTTDRYAGVDLSLAMDSPQFTPREGPPENIMLRTLGEPGQGFEGTLILDGTAQPLSGLTPFERSYTAKTILVDVSKRDQFGTIQFELATESGLYRAGILKYKGSRCRFGYHNNQIQVRSMN